MKRRFIAGFAAFALTFAAAGPALAFDCMRVSSSLQGLQQSTNGGNWTAFDMTASGGGVAAVLSFFGVPVSDAQLACFQTAYDNSGAPTYFALGTGVAGGKTNGPGVLAHNAPEKVLTNGTGIDHFDSTVQPVFENAASTCLA
ncbi:MAG: hypothetical protein QOJ25_2518 [Solirubrobacteraceae bacterium]|jgi:hypothetical protein|nr:hypothetical protein [Solirubrobacteraceae bacterium]